MIDYKFSTPKWPLKLLRLQQHCFLAFSIPFPLGWVTTAQNSGKENELLQDSVAATQSNSQTQAKKLTQQVHSISKFSSSAERCTNTKQTKPASHTTASLTLQHHRKKKPSFCLRLQPSPSLGLSNSCSLSIQSPSVLIHQLHYHV